MKSFWKFFILLVLGAAINLAGGIIGKTTLGYLFYFIGLAIVIAGFVFIFIKKSYFKDGRLKVLILGLVLSLLLASSATLLLNNSISRSNATNNPGSLFSLGRQGANGFTRSGTGNFGTNRTFGGNSGQGSTGQNGSGTNTANSAIAQYRIRSIVAVLLGWVFLTSGLILLLVAVIRFLTKKTDYKGARWKVLLLGLLVGAMLSSSTALLLTRRTLPGNFGQRSGLNGQNFARTPQANVSLTPGVPSAATQTAIVTPTLEATSTPQPTTTPEPTATATVQVINNLVVCLNYNIQVGINIRNFPSTTATNVGTIPAADCFTIDGKNSQYAGWYHMTPGQNGFGSIMISASADENALWINGANLDATAAQLNSLAEVVVTPTK